MILNMSPWSLVDRYQRFGETRCLHLLHWRWRWRILPKCYRTTQRCISEACNRNIHCRENLISHYLWCLKANCWGEYVRDEALDTEEHAPRSVEQTVSSGIYAAVWVRLFSEYSFSPSICHSGSYQTPLSPPLRYAMHRIYDHVTLS